MSNKHLQECRMKDNNFVDKWYAIPLLAAAIVVLIVVLMVVFLFSLPMFFGLFANWSAYWGDDHTFMERLK